MTVFWLALMSLGAWKLGELCAQAVNHFIGEPDALDRPVRCWADEEEPSFFKRVFFLQGPFEWEGPIGIACVAIGRIAVLVMLISVILLVAA